MQSLEKRVKVEPLQELLGETSKQNISFSQQPDSLNMALVEYVSKLQKQLVDKNYEISWLKSQLERRRAKPPL